MRQWIRHTVRAVTAASLLGSVLFAQETYRKEITLSSEQELRVEVELGFGTLEVARAGSGMVAELRYDGPPLSEEELHVDYRISGGRGVLQFRSREESIWGKRSGGRDGEDRRWTLLLTGEIPLELDLEFGAGEGTFDLTGLRVTDLELSSGASSVDLDCREPNPVRARLVRIESGVGKLSAAGLANLNFDRLTFSGGVGSYRLEFDGTLAQSGDVDVDVGLGAVALIIPHGAPVQLRYAKGWLSSLNLDDAFVKKRRDTYETESYNAADRRLTVSIESGLGSVSVRAR